MEKLNWKTNVDLVRLAKELLTSGDFKYSYDKENDTCMYRMPENPEVRCIVGRLFYGHIPEDHDFWTSKHGLDLTWRNLNLQEMFPYVSPDVLDGIQPWHDEAAWGNDPSKKAARSWKDLELAAKQADYLAVQAKEKNCSVAFLEGLC